MASRDRGSYPYWASGSRNNGSQQTVLDVAPLNCVPPSHTVNPGTSTREKSSVSFAESNSGPSSVELPAMVFFTSHPTTEEWNNIMTATKSGVALTGSAAKTKAGPAIGAVDIGQSEDEYLFRVSLPGVVRDGSVFSCDVQPDGQIVIKGKTSTGGKTVRKGSMVFQMRTQNLSPTGDFSISFHLPGPIDPTQPVRGVFGTDGVFEAIVRKSKEE